MRGITILIVILAMSGCMSEKKLAQKCADRYHVKDSMVITSEVLRDTIMVEMADIVILDTVVCPASEIADTIVVEKVIPGQNNTVVVERIVKDTVVLRENTAKVAYLNKVVIEKDEEIKTLKEKSSKSKERYRIVIAALITLIVSTVGLVVKK